MKNSLVASASTTTIAPPVVGLDVFLSLVEGLDDAIFILDRTYTLLIVNEKAQQTARAAYGVEIKVGGSMVYDFPEHRWPDLKLFFDRVFEGDTVQYELHTRDTDAWIHCYYFPLRDAAGKVVACCAKVRNITIEKQAEEAKQKQLELERQHHQSRQLLCKSSA